MKCSGCQKEVDKDPVACDSCKNDYCIGCSGLCQTELRVLQLKNRILAFNCCTCERNPLSTPIEECFKSMENKLTQVMEYLREELKFQDGKMDDQAVLINRLVNEVQELKSNASTKSPSYADIVHSNKTIVIKPKEKQESLLTKNDVKAKINPKTMAMAVENIKPGKDGAVIINCSNNNTRERIAETVAKEFGDKYSVEEAKRKNPKIIIRGVEEEFLEEEDHVIIEALKKQNELTDAEGKILGVIAKTKQRGKIDKGNIIIQVETNLRNKICSMGKLNIGWRRCVAHEYFSVVRCFRCARYGHMAAECKNSVTCFKCSESHATTDCTSDVKKCINCLENNGKFKTSLDTKHYVTSNECPCYQKIVCIEKKKTKQQ